MIIKAKEPVASDIEQLESLLNRQLTPSQEIRVRKELTALRQGHKGEQDSAYYIDFQLNSSKNWAVIHDLRIEFNGFAAQIDHLLINRFLEFYVLETKNFSNGLKINYNGEFLAWYKGKYHSIESPIEQNNRHIELFKKCIKASDIMPKRLGLTLFPSFKSLVLISPESRLIIPEKCQIDISMVVKADSFFSKILKDLDKPENSLNPVKIFSTVGKMCSSQTIMELAHRIISMHKPIEIDYRKRFGIGHNPVESKPTHTNAKNTFKKYICETCKKEIENKVFWFCWHNTAKLDGKILCRDCQKAFL